MLTIPSNSETMTTLDGKIMMTTKHHRMSSSLITMKLSKVIKANHKANNKVIKANHKANNKGSKAKNKANNKDHNNCIQT
jgi:hypothetical protein